jgi:hypothetical protein
MCESISLGSVEARDSAFIAGGFRLTARRFRCRIEEATVLLNMGRGRLTSDRGRCRSLFLWPTICDVRPARPSTEPAKYAQRQLLKP